MQLRESKKKSHKDRSRSRSKHRKRSKSRSGSRSRTKRSKRSRSRSRSRDRRRDSSRDRRRGARRSRSPRDDRSHRGAGFRRSSPGRRREKSPELTPEERDARTVFCMQLAARIRPRDLEEFFTAVGKIRDVRLITDPRTKRSKGIAYIEFRDVESVPVVSCRTLRILAFEIASYSKHENT